MVGRIPITTSGKHVGQKTPHRRHQHDMYRHASFGSAALECYVTWHTRAAWFYVKKQMWRIGSDNAGSSVWNGLVSFKELLEASFFGCVDQREKWLKEELRTALKAFLMDKMFHPAFKWLWHNFELFSLCLIWLVEVKLSFILQNF